MTREEAEIYAKTMTFEDALYNLSQARAIPYRKATLIKVNELIKALSQEPMRDFTEEEAEAYSKALDRMYKPTGFNVFNEPCKDAISRDFQIGDEVRRIRGKWKILACDLYMCSKCYAKYTFKSNFCPNCGARMVEPQESEDKE